MEELIPPALVLGCNTPIGLNPLSDWIEERTGVAPDFANTGWDDYPGYDKYGANDIVSGCGDGDYYGFGDGDGDGWCYGLSRGDGYGDGIGYGDTDGDGAGCGDIE